MFVDQICTAEHVMFSNIFTFSCVSWHRGDVAPCDFQNAYRRFRLSGISQDGKRCLAKINHYFAATVGPKFVSARYG